MKLRLMITAAIAAFAFAGTALAQDASQSADQAKQSAHDAWENTKDSASNGWDATKKETKDAYHRADDKLASRSVRGTVTKIDKDSLTIKDADGREVSLNRSASTRISDKTAQGKATLEEGSEVRASYRLDKNGDKWAKSVVITATPKASTLDSDHDQDDDSRK